MMLGLNGTVCALALVALCLPASAQDTGGFGPFLEEPINLPGSYRLIDDPTGKAPEARIHSFTISPGPCSDQQYDSGLSDCHFQSVRSQLYEKANNQPRDAWYQWWMYLPDDFPVADEQSGEGLYTFAYLHNLECPNVALVSETKGTGNLSLQTNLLSDGKCIPANRIDLVDLRSLRGGWHRFEMHVVFDRGDDGRAEVFVDGKKMADHRGRTLTKGAPDRNYFKFGIYLSGTKGTTEISPATVLYTGLRQAKSRDGLYTAEDRVTARALQAALNEIGCDVGAPDGIVGKRTQTMALSCRAFPDDALPTDLGPGNVGTFLALYTQDGVADLPAGSLPEEDSAEELAAVLPPGVVTPKFVVRAREIYSRPEGDKIDSEYNVVIDNNPDLEAFDFSLYGSYSSTEKSFYKLSFFLSANIESGDAVEACPGSTLTWPDGSDHALLTLYATGSVYLAPTADCLIGALPKDQAAAVRFLTTNFADIAVGMTVDGSIDSIQHDGVREFLRSVAMGEVTVRK